MRFLQSIFFALIVCQSAFSNELSTNSVFSKLPLEEGQTSGHSISPILGYEPTYRFVAGGAYFYESSQTGLGFDTYTNFRGVYQSHVRFRQALGALWSYQVHLVGIKGFEPYHGEGGETSPSNRVQLWGYRTYNEVLLFYSPKPLVTFGVVGLFRNREERPHENEPFKRYFPDENTGAVGLELLLGRTDKNRDPQNGFRFVLRPIVSSHFFQMEGGLTIYKEVFEEMVEGVSAAYHIWSGFTLGTPTYLYKFKLGGGDGLAGYTDNRFRGKMYYAQSTELRVPIWKMLTGAFSLSFGDTADTSFTAPKIAYGGGLRIGLPPDWVSKIRIDYVVGRDETGIFVDFGETF